MLAKIVLYLSKMHGKTTIKIVDISLIRKWTFNKWAVKMQAEFVWFRMNSTYCDVRVSHNVLR